MDWGIFFTIIGSAAAVVGLIYTIVRNFKNDFDSKFVVMEKKFELLDTRIFQLAMGKSLKEIMKEERGEK